MKKVIFVYVILLFFLTSCHNFKEDVYYNLHESDKFAIEANEILIYSSEFHKDTLTVLGTSTSYNCQQRDDGDLCYASNSARLKKLTTDTLFHNMYESITVSRTAKKVEFSVSWMTLSSNSDKATYIGHFPIHDVLVDSVYVCEGEKDKVLLDKSVKNVYYCKRLGVLQYQTFDGEVYTLEKNKLCEYVEVLAKRDSVMNLQRELLTKMQDMRK